MLCGPVSKPGPFAWSQPGEPSVSTDMSTRVTEADATVPLARPATAKVAATALGNAKRSPIVEAACLNFAPIP